MKNFKIKVIFKWFDLWIGLFIDRPKKTVYIFFIPMIGIIIEYETRCKYCRAFTHQPDKECYKYILK